MTQINFWLKIIYKHSLVQEGLNYLLLITAPRLVLLGLLLTRKAQLQISDGIQCFLCRIS